MPQGLKEIFYHIYTHAKTHIWRMWCMCQKVHYSALPQFDSKNWDSFLACVHCRHANLPITIKWKNEDFSSWLGDHLKPVDCNVNLVLQWNYIWLMIMFNQTWVGHKCLVNLSKCTLCFCQALNLQSFLLQALVMNWWADKKVKKTVQAQWSERQRKMAFVMWPLSVATGCYRTMWQAHFCSANLSEFCSYLTFISP